MIRFRYTTCCRVPGCDFTCSGLDEGQVGREWRAHAEQTGHRSSEDRTTPERQAA